MAYKKKTWREKLGDKKNMPKILTLEPTFPCYKPAVKMGAKAGDNVVLVNPSEVVEVMNRVPRGKLATIYEICRALARNYKVPACCSLTTGIFIMTAANAAEEDRAEGRKNTLPYWRTLKADGFLNEKYPGGQGAHKKLLEQEGFTVLPRGKRYAVKDFEKYLITL